jgi:hypothetical protein
MAALPDLVPGPWLPSAAPAREELLGAVADFRPRGAFKNDFLSYCKLLGVFPHPQSVLRRGRVHARWRRWRRWRARAPPSPTPAASSRPFCARSLSNAAPSPSPLSHPRRQAAPG